MRLALALSAMLLVAGAALAHSWYPIECCSQRDCHAVQPGDLVEVENGDWRYLPLDIVFPAKQVRPSLDRHQHVCYGPDLRPLCVFVHQGS